MGALGTIKKDMENYSNKIPGNINIHELQKIILLSTAHLLMGGGPLHQVETVLVWTPMLREKITRNYTSISLVRLICTTTTTTTNTTTTTTTTNNNNNNNNNNNDNNNNNKNNNNNNNRPRAVVLFFSEPRAPRENFSSHFRPVHSPLFFREIV